MAAAFKSEEVRNELHRRDSVAQLKAMGQQTELIKRSLAQIEAVIVAMKSGPAPVVNVAVPEIKIPAPQHHAPRKWIFTHRYDQQGNLTQTIAKAAD